MNLGKLFRRGLIAFIIVIFLLTAAIVDAAVQIFDGAGQYIMSDFENHDIAKQRAQQRAERDAQKKAGVYMKNFSRTVNAMITDDEISAVTNNIIKVSDVKIVSVPFEANGEAGIMYRATLKAKIDTDGIYSWIKRDEKERVTIIQQNNSLQDAIVKNDKQIEDLKEKYNHATSKSEKDRIRKQMNYVDREFLANQKNDNGLKLYYSQNYEDAIKFYKEAIELNPNCYEAYSNRGVVYAQLKQYERAIQDFDKSILINPNYSEAYSNLGVAHSELKQYELSIQYFNKAIELNPDNAITYLNRPHIAVGGIESIRLAAGVAPVPCEGGQSSASVGVFCQLNGCCRDRKSVV